MTELINNMLFLAKSEDEKQMPEMSMRQKATDEGSMPSAKQMRDTGPRSAHAKAAVTQ